MDEMEFVRSNANKIFRSNSSYRESWISNQLATIPSGNSILDAGSGGQPFRKYCQHLRYTALDFGQLDAGNLIIEGQYGHIDIRSDITSIPLPNASFDAVMCTEVLEHVFDPTTAITELGRVLKPGGILLLTAPLCSFEHQAPHHFYGGFSRFWYERALSEASFTAIRVEQNGSFFRFFGQECQRLVRILFRHRRLWSWKRVVLLPLELTFAAAFSMLIPAICFVIDKMVPTPGVTLGYHVTAKKKDG
jgi:ubiquinone/menaquinone biosynthesis C-methylase UbiE